ncbi:hypothetical protein [Massilia sp. NR 4-1]|uniref:hypothetical protein n=1 Tax=Massilia sp. NR 4-1 TaxID=1678028 RepID=UPI00067DADFA|nr:hypothetical protein [Massilia sp. NR 4-1]AKU21201.1 hypothetical protein ACZ75_06625 [Massilia sp. NR 4-1]
MFMRTLECLNEVIYKALGYIPIVSTVIKIVNSYVFEGDVRAMDRFAPWWLWFKAIGLPLIVAVLIAASLLHDSFSFPHHAEYKFDLNGSLLDVKNCFELQLKSPIAPLDAPGQLILSVFPNLLGFGIGVYALIFALSPKSLQFLQEHLAEQFNAKKRKQGSALMLNSSMAYPLLVIAISIVPAVFQQMNGKNALLIFSGWTVFWYGFVVVVELLGVLFSLGEHDAIDKLSLEERN